MGGWAYWSIRKYEELTIELKDYSTEELKAELKRRNDLIITKKAKIKKCKICKHWGKIDCMGAPTNNYTIFRLRRCCKFFKGQTSKLYISHLPSQDACVHFEEIDWFKNIDKVFISNRIKI